LTEIASLLENRNLEYLKRYHSRLKKVGDYGFTIMSPDEDEMFVARINGVGNEVLVSFQRTTSGYVDYALNKILIREDGEWKISSLHLCTYSANDETALTLYEDAKELSETGYSLPAFFKLILWNQLFELGDNFHYKNIDEMQKFMQELYDSFTESAEFPIVFDKLEGVSVFNLDTKVFYQGNFPEVLYITETDIDDDAKIEEEAAMLHELLTGEYPGMAQAFNEILYTAYNEYPLDPEKTYRAYGTFISLE